MFTIPAIYSVIIGIIISITIFIYFIRNFLQLREKNLQINGLLVYNKNANELVEVDRYPFSEHMSRYIKSAFNENEAFKKLWDKEPLSKLYTNDGLAIQLESKKIIKEATEYFFLNKLSTHLTDYFNRYGVEKNETITFLRNDIPDVLFSNRFLELFSKPMIDRPLFVDDYDEPRGEIVSAYSNDAIYEKFDLTLPKGSVITRKDNLLIIETDRFLISADMQFQGFGFFVPPHFEDLYLKISKGTDIADFEIELTLNIKFKLMSIFSSKGWEYYNWIDSFIEELNNDFSGDEFFKSIYWEQTMTILKCLDK